MKRVTVMNQTRNVALADVEWRGTLFGRARGLLGRARLDPGDGIAIVPCSSVHMCFMRFAIDVLYLDRDGIVTKVVTALRPYRISVGGRGTHSTIELAAGTLAQSGTAVGDQIVFRDRTQVRAA